MNHPTNIDPTTFNTEVVESSKPVLVDFWGTLGAAPARMMAPCARRDRRQPG
ncbi:thioredoxin family protein [Chthoniobacter flavus]|uniref:thioredoxin family protein n=1 Tax=Chthoniobacter flavus TaxID=191863 RepID=UPI0002EEC9C9|nr:hypothetical protein [Chthoniobacter flavus]